MRSPQGNQRGNDSSQSKHTAMSYVPFFMPGQLFQQENGLQDLMLLLRVCDAQGKYLCNNGSYRSDEAIASVVSEAVQ